MYIYIYIFSFYSLLSHKCDKNSMLIFGIFIKENMMLGLILFLIYLVVSNKAIHINFFRDMSFSQFKKEAFPVSQNYL